MLKSKKRCWASLKWQACNVSHRVTAYPLSNRQKFKSVILHAFFLNPVISLLRIYLEDILAKFQSAVCSSLFSAVLFVIAKDPRKKISCQSIAACVSDYSTSTEESPGQEGGSITADCSGLSPGSIIKWTKQSTEKYSWYAAPPARKEETWLCFSFHWETLEEQTENE